MMRIKKLMALCMAFVMIVSSTSLSLASSQSNVTQLSRVNVDVLFEEAISGISDIDVKELTRIGIEPKVNLMLHNEIIDIEAPLVTARVIETKNVSNTEKFSKISVTTFVPLDKNLAVMSTQNFRNRDDYFFNMSVYGYNTIDYDVTTKYHPPTGGSANYYRMNGFSGGWRILDSTCSLSGYRVTYGIAGQEMNTLQTVTKNATKYPTSYTFSYTGFSEFVYVNNALFGAFGGNSSVVITRGGTTYNATLNNSLI